MSVNKYRPHVLVLPEDDANRQLANGFDLNLASRQLQVLAPSGGWALVRDSFVADHIVDMQRNPHRFMVLLIDFDNNLNRLEAVRASIPIDLTERVFVSALSNPEALRQGGLGSYEAIGGSLADDCRDRTQTVWSHQLLQHNEAELARLRNAVCDFLFPSQPQTGP
jgi:hypothetical protein